MDALVVIAMPSGIPQNWSEEIALRLGYTISGGVPGLLGGVSLALADNAVTLAFTPASAGRYGEIVQRRLDALGRAMARRAEVRGVPNEA